MQSSPTDAENAAADVTRRRVTFGIGRSLVCSPSSNALTVVERTVRFFEWKHAVIVDNDGGDRRRCRQSRRREAMQDAEDRTLRQALPEHSRGRVDSITTIPNILIVGGLPSMLMKEQLQWKAWMIGATICQLSMVDVVDVDVDVDVGGACGVGSSTDRQTDREKRQKAKGTFVRRTDLQNVSRVAAAIMVTMFFVSRSSDRRR